MEILEHWRGMGGAAFPKSVHTASTAVRRFDRNKFMVDDYGRGSPKSSKILSTQSVRSSSEK